jgi:hypothetical protein
MGLRVPSAPMSLTVVLELVGLVVWTVIVAAVSIAWGKAHPTVQSAIADAVGKVEKKL